MQVSICTITIALFFCQIGGTQTYIAGETYFGVNDYIEYKAGNLPIVISAPHGGSLEPAGIPDRNCTGCVYVKDAFTEELIRQMYDAIFDLFGCYPHVIINRLHRRKLDANRAIGEAADGNAMGEQAWTEFQGFIETAKDTIEVNYGKGLYLDLHGHGHDIQRLELGYRISKSALQLPDTTLNQNIYVNDASIKNLVNINLNNISFPELLRGTESFGQFYEQEGYPSVPSKNDPYPNDGDSYFSGGYNTERHGSKSSGTIDAIQIECNREGVRDSEANRAFFASATALVIRAYFETHYFEADFFNANCELQTNTKNDIEQQDIEVISYPNPVKDYLNVNLTGTNQKPISVLITNGLGQLVFEGKYFDTSLFQIDLQDFPPGVYFLKVATGNAVGFQSILK